MQYKDEFDDGPDFRGAVSSIFKVLDRGDSVPKRGPLWAGAIVLALVAFLGSVLWYSYPREAAKREILAVPIIRADAGPYKVVPRDPGGMEIPHRDSTIFDTLRASREEEGNRRIENLLAEAEQPLPRDQFFSGLKTEIKVEGREIINTAAQEPAAEEKPQEEPVAVAKAEAAPVDITTPVTDSGEEKVASLPMPVPPAKPDRIAEEVSKTEPAAGVETFESGSKGGFYAQLGSMGTQEAAASAWKDLQKSIAALQPVSHRIEKADLGARGTYYRVQAGPFDEARAKEICAAVAAQRPGGCLVVKN